MEMFRREDASLGNVYKMPQLILAMVVQCKQNQQVLWPQGSAFAASIFCLYLRW